MRTFFYIIGHILSNHNGNISLHNFYPQVDSYILDTSCATIYFLTNAKEGRVNDARSQ